jgi:hypothetical protein
MEIYIRQQLFREVLGRDGPGTGSCIEDDVWGHFPAYYVRNEGNAAEESGMYGLLTEMRGLGEGLGGSWRWIRGAAEPSLDLSSVTQVRQTFRGQHVSVRHKTLHRQTGTVIRRE